MRVTGGRHRSFGSPGISGLCPLGYLAGRDHRKPEGVFERDCRPDITSQTAQEGTERECREESRGECVGHSLGQGTRPVALAAYPRGRPSGKTHGKIGRHVLLRKEARGPSASPILVEIKPSARTYNIKSALCRENLGLLPA